MEPASVVDRIARLLLKYRRVNMTLTNYSTGTIFLALHCLHKTLFPLDPNAQLSCRGGLFAALSNPNEILLGTMNRYGTLDVELLIKY